MNIINNDNKIKLLNVTANYLEVIFFEDLWQNFMRFSKFLKYLRKLSLV